MSIRKGNTIISGIGNDGISPTASVSKSGTTTTLTVTDRNGTTTANIIDGTNGTDGRDGYVQYTAGTNIAIENDVISALDSRKYFEYRSNMTSAQRLTLFQDWYNYYAQTGDYTSIRAYQTTYNKTFGLLSFKREGNTIYLILGANQNAYYDSQVDYYNIQINLNNSGEVTSTSVSSYPQSFNPIQMYYTGIEGALRTDNTWSYTPTANYHPATKKYVDDAVAGAGGGGRTYFTYYNNMTSAEKITFFQDWLDYYLETGDYNSIRGYQANPSHFNRYFGLISFKRQYDNYELILGAYKNATFGSQLDYYSITIYTSDGETVTSVTSDTALSSFYTAPQYISGNNGALMTDNTWTYTPTSDYHPATKKYVDDKLTTLTGYDASKTQVLKNINGTLTWVDE